MYTVDKELEKHNYFNHINDLDKTLNQASDRI